MSANYRKKYFLKDCIADALIELMQHKCFNKIPIEEIIEKAGIGRATYYRNFQSKQEVLTYKLIRHWETNAEERNLRERNKFDINNALAFFEINYMIKDFLSLIYSQNQQKPLQDAFYQIMIPSEPENKTFQYRESFYASGLFGLLDQWIRNGFSETPQEMAEMLLKICQQINLK